MLHRMGREGLEGEQRLETREWGTRIPRNRVNKRKTEGYDRQE